MFGQEDWNLKVRGRDVTIRVTLQERGHATMTGFHVLYGPSQVGLDIEVQSRQDAMEKVEGLLCKLMGDGWY